VPLWLVLLSANFIRISSMGVLTVGSPMKWVDSIPHLKYVRQHGVLQFINRYNQVRAICNDELKWGDEIEYAIVRMDAEAKQPYISLRAASVRDELNARERDHTEQVENCNWMPEYGSWMVEGTPGKPYAGYSVRCNPSRLSPSADWTTHLSISLFPRRIFHYSTHASQNEPSPPPPSRTRSPNQNTGDDDYDNNYFVSWGLLE
jgi:hypothetical protein